MATITQRYAAAGDTWVRTGRTPVAEGTTPVGGYDPPPPAGRASVWSDTFVDQVANINVLFKNATTSYGNWQECADYVIDLGMRTIRDRLIPTSSQARTNQRLAAPYLAAAGCKWHSSIGVAFTTVEADVDAVITEVDGQYGSGAVDVFRSFGGMNESNNSPKPGNWATATVQNQQWIFDKVNANTNLQNILVVGPALKDNEATLQADFAALGAAGINAYCDRGDFHRYPGGIPTNLLDQRVTWARQAFPSPKLLYVTEGGFNQGGIGGGVNFPVDVQAAYYLRWFAECYLRNLRPFAFELMDDPGTAWESNFGIVEVNGSLTPANWTLKPAYTAIKRFFGRIADPGTTWTPASLSITVSGGDSDYSDILLQRRDGKWLLLMWRDVKLYQTPNGPTLTITPQTITITLATAKPVAVYNPRTSATATVTRASNTTHPISVAGDLLIVEIG